MKVDIHCPHHAETESVRIPDTSRRRVFEGEVPCARSEAGRPTLLRIRVVDGGVISVERAQPRWAAPPIPSPPSSRVRILLVEDQLVVCEALCDLIERDQALKPVRAVGTGEEALSLLKTTKFDVAVVDLSLPGMSGIETTRQIKGRYPQVKVVVLTGQGAGALHEAMAAGADRFLTKAVDGGKLRSAIHDVHQSRESEGLGSVARELRKKTTMRS